MQLHSLRLDAVRWGRFAVLLLLVGVLAIAAIACSDDDDEDDTGATAGDTASEDAGDAADDTDDLSSLSGSVLVDGSSTVFPVTEAVAEEFRGVAPDVRVTVGVSGTGGGFTKFCADEIDIADASRPIKDTEIEECAANGIEYLELRVGLDGLAVVTNSGNEFLTDITEEELHTLWGPEAEGTITRWNQVRADWPDDEITLFGPDVDSGTFDFFTEEINGEGGASRADYTASADDNVLVNGVSQSSGALAYFGYAYYIENQDKLQVVPVDGITPSDETVSDGSYPLARPLFIYVNLESLASKPHVREFVRFYLSDAGISLVPEVGYTNVSATELQASRDALEAAIGG